MRTCLGLAAALWLAAPAGWAVDWKSLKPQGYLSDFAAVVDPAGKAHLAAYAAALEQATGAHLDLVTLPAIEGEPVADVARSIARAWGAAQKNPNDEVLVLLAIGDRRSRIELGAALASVLPPAEDTRVLAEMAPALRAQQYGEALMAAAETVGGDIAHARQVKLTATLPRRIRPTFLNSVPWPVVAGFVLELAFLAYLVAWALPRAAGGHRAFLPAGAFTAAPPLVLASGAQSGGGFGSFDSSDSFGGFGGGDHGRGASSDW